VATFVAAVIASQIYLSMLDHGHAFWRIFACQFISWSFWAVAAPMILAPGRSTIGAIVLGTALIATHACLTAAGTVLVQPYQPLPPSTFQGALAGQLTGLLPIDVAIYAFLLLVRWALAAHDEARRLAIRESQLAVDLARAQLAVLRLEIQPHFLFNTLNAIAALIRRRSNERALDMLVGLSELMRYTVEGRTDPEVLLEAELDFVRRYVELQQARFDGRLTTAYRVDDDCRAWRVPAFLLQPIVENAVRHGLARAGAPCHVEIQAAIVPSGGLRISVSDTGVGLRPGFDLDHDAHTGLRNIRDRLHRLYGTAAHLTVAPRAEGGVVTSVYIPPPEGEVGSATA
jgi:hypothetical protein